jgi:hypothetical protein
MGLHDIVIGKGMAKIFMARDHIIQLQGEFSDRGENFFFVAGAGTFKFCQSGWNMRPGGFEIEIEM